jgi:hypothetical protein
MAQSDSACPYKRILMTNYISCNMKWGSCARSGHDGALRILFPGNSESHSLQPEAHTRPRPPSMMDWSVSSGYGVLFSERPERLGASRSTKGHLLSLIGSLVSAAYLHFGARSYVSLTLTTAQITLTAHQSASRAANRHACCNSTPQSSSSSSELLTPLPCAAS